MSEFTKPVILKMLPERNFEVYESFEFHVGEYPSLVVVRVHAGFVTDLASIPRPFWAIMPPHGEYAKAAIVHDYIYRTPFENFTRREADDIFLEGMEVLGVAKWRRNVIYYAVRAFGWLAFKKRS